MPENDIAASVPITGEGYANLESGDSYKGRITVTDNWVTVKNSNGRYTIPRRKVDFVNWKEVA